MWRALVAAGTGWLVCAGRGAGAQPATAPALAVGPADCGHRAHIDASVCAAPAPPAARSAAEVAALLAACWRPEEEPELDAFLGQAAADDVAWRASARALWPEGATTPAAAPLAARLAAAAALDLGEVPRAAAVGSLLAQQPEQMGRFVARTDGHVEVHLAVFGSDGRAATLTLTMAATLPSHGNGTLALGDGQGTSLMPFLRKLALKLDVCGRSLGVGLTGVSEVLGAVLGRRGTAVRLGGGELGRQLAGAQQRGTLAVGAASFDGTLEGSRTGLGVASTDAGLHLTSVDGSTDVWLAPRRAYGLLGAVAANASGGPWPAPSELRLFAPLGTRDDTTAAAGRVHAGRDSRTVAVPTSLLDGLGGALTLVD